MGKRDLTSTALQIALIFILGVCHWCNRKKNQYLIPKIRHYISTKTSQWNPTVSKAFIVHIFEGYWIFSWDSWRILFFGTSLTTHRLPLLFFYSETFETVNVLQKTRNASESHQDVNSEESFNWNISFFPTICAHFNEMNTALFFTNVLPTFSPFWLISSHPLQTEKIKESIEL